MCAGFLHFIPPKKGLIYISNANDTRQQRKNTTRTGTATPTTKVVRTPPLPHHWKKLFKKMAKGATKAGAILVRVVSTLDTGFFYVKRKNPKKMPNKLEFRKYDPRARKHCLFVESKQK